MEETITLRKKLERDGRVLAMAKKLEALLRQPDSLSPGDWASVTKAAVIGWLFRLWTLGSENCTEENVLRGFKEEDVDGVIGFRTFAKLLPADWISVGPNGQIILPNFRERSAKEKSFSPSFGSPLSSPTPPPIPSPDSSPSSEKKGRGGVRGGDSHPLIPENLNVASFFAAWEEWAKHRREIGKRLTNRAIQKQWAKMSQWGPDRAIAAIHHSILQGYQGIYEEKELIFGRNQTRRVGSDSRVRAEPGKYDGLGVTLGQTPPQPQPESSTPARSSKAPQGDRTLFENDVS